MGVAVVAILQLRKIYSLSVLKDCLRAILLFFLQVFKGLCGRAVSRFVLT